MSVFKGPNNTKDLNHEDDELDAMYVGILFLNAVFVAGRGIMVFAVFGLEYETVIKPLIKWCKTVRSLHKEPPSENWKDARLYHWTLTLIARLFSIIPRRRRSKAEQPWSGNTISNGLSYPFPFL